MVYTCIYTTDFWWTWRCSSSLPHDSWFYHHFPLNPLRTWNCDLLYLSFPVGAWYARCLAVASIKKTTSMMSMVTWWSGLVVRNSGSDHHILGVMFVPIGWQFVGVSLLAGGKNHFTSLLFIYENSEFINIYSQKLFLWGKNTCMDYNVVFIHLDVNPSIACKILKPLPA